jgi:hypothetical protein
LKSGGTAHGALTDTRVLRRFYATAPSVSDSSPEPALGLLPEVDARALLAGKPLRFRLLRPPYPAIGTGVLRALRVAEVAGAMELVAGYDGYERIETRERSSSGR